MTTFAAPQDTERRRAELEARTRDAWTTYRDELIELDGKAYAEAEAASWEHLQTSLREIADQRAELVPAR